MSAGFGEWTVGVDANEHAELEAHIAEIRVIIARLRALGHDTSADEALLADAVEALKRLRDGGD